MPNILAPYGFRHTGYITGHPANFGNARVNIQASYATSINFGDPIVRLPNGYIGKAPAGATQIHGIFIGCQYLSAVLGYTRYSNFFPGNGDAVTDAVAWVVSTPDAVFQAQSGNSIAAAVAAGTPLVGLNIGLAYGVNPAAVGTSRMSSAERDRSTVGVGVPLPFKIVSLVSDPPATNGTDPTTPFNDLVVAFNNSDYHAPTAGI